MGKGVTNLELLRRAMAANGAAQQLFQQLTTEPPESGAELYDIIRQVRDHTRSAACAVVEVKFRIKNQLTTPAVAKAMAGKKDAEGKQT